jgi:pre-mRNA-processing factor 17
MGHSRTVKDVCFNNDGTQFLSGSYDKTVKLWDTETGKCIQRFNAQSIVNCIKFNPKPELHHMFLAGLANKKILQFDARTAQVIQEYDHHLAGVNSITFVDEDHRFMTTSDDKSVRVWDWEINVPIKFLADPDQHSMPSVKLHPAGKYVAAQSMDNTIVVIGATDRFRMNRKKRFTGYTCAGYNIDVDFSPDGKYLMSGDIYGNAVFWDWKSSQQKSKFKAHDKPVLCIAAHPQEQSKVATAGLDAVIHYWD